MGPHIWTVGHGRLPDTLRGMRGSPALGGPSRSGQKRQGGCVRVFCARGEGENSATCHCCALAEHAPRCAHCLWRV